MYVTVIFVKFQEHHIPLRQFVSAHKWKWIWWKSKQFVTHSWSHDKNSWDFMRWFWYSLVVDWCCVKSMGKSFVSWIFISFSKVIWISICRLLELRIAISQTQKGLVPAPWSIGGLIYDELCYCLRVFFIEHKDRKGWFKPLISS